MITALIKFGLEEHSRGLTTTMIALIQLVIRVPKVVTRLNVSRPYISREVFVLSSCIAIFLALL